MKVDRSKFRKRIICPFTLQEFDIRRVDIRFYMRDLGVLPVDTSKSVAQDLAQIDGESLKRKSEEPDFEDKSVRFFLTHGIISPKIWFGEEDECPDDQIPYLDLGADRWFLAEQIAEWSSSVGDLSSLEHFFFGDRPGDLRPSGEAVRKTANGTPANGNDSTGDGPVVQHERGPEGIDSGVEGKPEGEPTEGIGKVTK